MALNLVSPGVKVREVDLTIGRIDTINDQVGAIAGPFQKGPIDTPVFVENEQDLLRIFGYPQVADGQNEYWWSASNYLSYGGSLRVIRCGSTAGGALNNSNSGTSGSPAVLTIKSKEDYDSSTPSGWYYSSKNPGSWANNLKVCVIDNFADQIITGVSTVATFVSNFSSVVTKTGVVLGVTTTSLTGINTTSLALGQFIEPISGIVGSSSTITGIGTSSVTFSPASLNGTSLTLDLNFGTRSSTQTGAAVTVGCAVTQSLNKTGPDGVVYGGYLRGVVKGVGENEVYVRITDRVENNISTPVEYKNPGNANESLNIYSFDSFRSSPLNFSTSAGVALTSIITEDIKDWYNQQTLGLVNQTIYWRNIAEKPGTSQYAAERNSKYDEINIAVVDDSGSVTGTAANIVEKFSKLTKSLDGRISPQESVYYKDYISNNSEYLFVGESETGSFGSIVVGASATTYSLTSGSWDRPTQGVVFNVIGKKTYTLSGGTDYSGNANIGGYAAGTGNIKSSYETLRNPAEYSVNYLIYGPSSSNIYESQDKANSLISIAEERKDCIAVISPFKSDVVGEVSSATQTEKIISFFSPITSSSYAVFDSGYKYTYDRFNNAFLYLPCNSDVAGLMCRTSSNNYPWFSPAGSSRGSLNNVIKLAYNPSQSQRDDLYSNRINPIIANSGAGFILFGDKTALSYPSAFDRINVRRLFLTLESTIERAARAQLFEFNDIITRNNFVNIVEPYLRDIKAKRGITEFVVICDETNNTPDIIDSNQFKADIFIKPARSINYIGLTFVATRTGVSFSEVVGTV
jgi:hypothetical protein